MYVPPNYLPGSLPPNESQPKASALTLESTASHLRVPDWKEEKVIKKNVVRAGRAGNWKGVKPYSSDILTCEVEVPRGHLSVRMGKLTRPYCVTPTT